MKLFSKDGLILGGLYFVPSFALLFFDNDIFETIRTILFFAFVYFAFLIQFNKAPNFVKKFPAKFPKTASYIEALGWIPYFEILISLTVIICSFLFVSGENKLNWIVPYIPVFYFSYVVMILGSFWCGYKKNKLKAPE